MARPKKIDTVIKKKSMTKISKQKSIKKIEDKVLELINLISKY